MAKLTLPRSLLVLVASLALLGACASRAVDKGGRRCVVRDDCKEGEVCFRDHCRPENYCEQPSDCPGGELAYCENNTCGLAECTATLDTCGSYACDPTAKACRRTCDSSEHCRAGLICRNGACEEPQCSSTEPDACHGHLCTGGRCEKTCGNCLSGYTCVQGSCRRSSDHCTVDEDCGTGSCCPTELDGWLECSADACQLVADGESCKWGAMCASGFCEQGICARCQAETCAPAPCEGLECGTVLGEECGKCSGLSLCAHGQCEEVCVGRICGEDRGVSCGTCANPDDCNAAGQCVLRCTNMTCGEDRGLSCGTCADKHECQENRCVNLCPSGRCGGICGDPCGAWDVCNEVTGYCERVF